MTGFLLVAPTGSGKSWVCENDSIFRQFATDGDRLIRWPTGDWSRVDWSRKDREHLDIVLTHMQTTRKCVCWFVGTTAISDAIAEGRLSRDEVGVLLLPEDLHRERVVGRGQKSHDWTVATDHRSLCLNLIRSHGLSQFSSFEDASTHIGRYLNTSVL